MARSRVAILTGAAGGIGQAAAAAFLRLGIHVVAVDRLEPELHAFDAETGLRIETAR